MLLIKILQSYQEIPHKLIPFDTEYLFNLDPYVYNILKLPSFSTVLFKNKSEESQIKSVKSQIESENLQIKGKVQIKEVKPQLNPRNRK